MSGHGAVEDEVDHAVHQGHHVHQLQEKELLRGIKTELTAYLANWVVAELKKFLTKRSRQNSHDTLEHREI